LAYKPVEAVVFWRYEVSAFKAVYGRFNSDGYTKNYLQTSGSAKVVLDEALHRAVGENIVVRWRWPGGELVADWKEKVSGNDRRGELDIRVGQDTVLPFKLGDRDADVFATILGDPDQQTAQGANVQLNAMTARHEEPWLVAVKLQGEDDILHARVYLGNPPPGLETRSVAVLPKVVRDAMAALGNKGSGGVRLRGAATSRAPALMARIKAALAKDPNVLLVGPPGTGKTVVLEDLRAEYETNTEFDPDLWDHNWRSPEDAKTGRRALGLVFHPSYAYENFVAGLAPGTGQGITLEARPGPLLNLAHWASNSEREALLIIDEFNRGPAAAIFGDTLALLDVEKRSTPLGDGASITRPFTDRDMTVADTFKRVDGAVEIDAELKLPRGIAIVAAMNSSDRSVAPIDAALRRRFAIIRVDPDYDVLSSRLGIAVPDLALGMAAAAGSRDEVAELAVRVLMTLNLRIDLILGPDFLLGHALLWPVMGETREALGEALVTSFEQRIISTLRLTFVDQDEALAAILKVDGSTAGSVAFWRQPPPALASAAGPRLEFTDLAGLNDLEAQLAALRSILGD